MTITIETIYPKELPALVELSCATFHETFHADNTSENMKMFMEANFNEEKLGSELQKDDVVFFFAKINDKPVGYMKANLHVSTSGYSHGEAMEIARLYVRESSKGLGIGKALITHAFQLAVQLGKKIVWLGVWERNIKAIGFYTKLGFDKYGEHAFMLGEDLQNDWLMKKVI